MNADKWMAEIAEFKQALETLNAQARRDDDYRNGKTWEERMVLRRHHHDARKKLEGKIKYRENKLAALDGPPVHLDVFGQEFKVGSRVAWSSSGRYARPYLGWVVKITAKQVSVATTYAFNADDEFDPEAYGTSLMPSSLIVCDAIVERINEGSD